MPDADSNRKRSRSPSDSEQHKNKRPNTGASNPSDDARDPNSATAAPDFSMTDAPVASNDDNASPTPSSNQSEKPKEEASSDSRSTSVLGNGDKSDSATTSATPSASTTTTSPPTAQIHMRCLIVTQDASIIIGRSGAHVNEIRERSGARVVVSESIPGNPERILNVSGPLDAVSKVCCFVTKYIPEFTPVQGFWTHRTSH